MFGLTFSIAPYRYSIGDKTKETYLKYYGGFHPAATTASARAAADQIGTSGICGR